jgi:hypothetical protein
MLGQPGTTPLDMFKLRVDDLQEELHQDKKAIREVFKVSVVICRRSQWMLPVDAACVLRRSLTDTTIIYATVILPFAQRRRKTLSLQPQQPRRNT